MTIKLRPNTLAPIERGIDRVVRDVGSSSAELPDFVDLALAEMPAHSQLDQLLALPNIEEFVAAALRPKVDDTQILTPGAFRSVLEATLAGLRRAAEKQPRAARSYGRAARLLADEASLRDLLYMYRSALQQG
jgi:type III secretion protein X